MAEFTLADGQSNTSTSLLRSFCHADDSVILGTKFQVRLPLPKCISVETPPLRSQFQDAEESGIEDQLLANSASGSGALEHDPCSLFQPLTTGERNKQSTKRKPLFHSKGYLGGVCTLGTFVQSDAVFCEVLYVIPKGNGILVDVKPSDRFWNLRHGLVYGVFSC